MAVMQPIVGAPSFPGRPDMEWIEGGSFLMGSDHHDPEERPKRRVYVDGFWIDRRPVSNWEFMRFTEATGYTTVAQTGLRDGARDRWGTGSNVESRGDRPVVHLALADVEAYAAWAGASLPTEKEWEYAARGGRRDADSGWGDEFGSLATVWQEVFPDLNRPNGGWIETSPIGTYPPNGYGLFDMIGNVWEWTEDWWLLHPIDSPAKVSSSVKQAASADPDDPLRTPRRVLKGGPDLSAPGYYRRYRPSARLAHPIDRPMSHIGFRCVVRPGWGR